MNLSPRIIYKKINSLINGNIILILLVTVGLIKIEEVIWFLKQVKHFFVFGLGFENYPKIDFNVVGVLSSLLLAIVTIILALNANNTAKESMKISGKSLKTERPILSAEYTDEGGNEKVLKIFNIGTLEAEKIRVIVFNSKTDYFLLKEYDQINLVSKAGSLDIILANYEKIVAFIILYSNEILQEEYRYGFEVVKRQNGVRQIGLSDDSILDYEYYRNFQYND